MPLPKRKPSENRNDFVSRCMTDTKMKTEFPENRIRYAVCYQRSRENLKRQ